MTPNELLDKAKQALKSARLLCDADDPDGASIGLEDAKLIVDQAEVFVGAVSEIVRKA